MAGEYVFYFLLPLLGGIVLYYVMKQVVLTPGRTLAGKFAGLGDPKGKTKDQVLGIVGYPNSVSKIGSGELLQWMATGYHIALTFDEKGICQGISHEYSATGPITRPPTGVPSIMPVVCPNCGSRNKLGAKFCGACGKSIQQVRET